MAADILSGRQILILSSVEWDSAWQRHQVFATQWAAAGHEVFFVENTGFRSPGLRDAKRLTQKLAGLTRLQPSVRRPLPKNIHIINPLVLPPTASAMRRINENLLVPRLTDQLTRQGLRPGALAIAYLPTATTLTLLDRVRPEITIYDCVDNFFGHPTPPKDLAETEKALVRRSALVVTTSSTLREDKSRLHANVVELHHGVSPDFFITPATRDGYKRFCYFGTLWRAVDYAPIRALAEAGFEIELIGPCREPLPPLPNTVRIHGPVPHEELPRLLAGCDALLLPYADDEYNRGVIPAKTYECLATGRPVLSSPLPALQSLADSLYFSRGPEDWVRTARALPQSENEQRRAARVSVARAHTHDKAFAELRRAISDCLAAPHEL